MAVERRYIFDTTVLSAFAVVERLDLLEDRYAGRAAWTAEVYAEVTRGIAEAPSLGAILIADWLGEPIQSFDVVTVERIRRALGGKSDPYRHLGEAATLAAAVARGFVVAIDDYDATRYAKHSGIPTISTVSVLRAHVREGVVQANEAAALLAEMIDVHGRRLPRLDETEMIEYPAP